MHIKISEGEAGEINIDFFYGQQFNITIPSIYKGREVAFIEMYYLTGLNRKTLERDIKEYLLPALCKYLAEN